MLAPIANKLPEHLIPVMVEVVGVPLVEALRMASGTPAGVAGAGERKGALAAGYDADIVIFEEDFAVWGTMAGGRWVYRAD